MGTIIAPSSFYHPKCAEFNGTDEYMSRTSALSFRSDTAGAWSMWVRIPATFGADGVQVIWGLGTSGTNRFQLQVRRISNTGTGTYFSMVSIVGGATVAYSGTTTALTAGAWHHVVMQSSGTAWSMYVDGVLQTLTRWSALGSNTGDWFGDHTGTGPWFTVGVQNGPTSALGANFFDGRLDQFVYIGGRALTAGEVTEIYNSGTPTNPHKWSFASDVDLWLPLGDSRDSATTAFDEIGSNDMTLVNMDASNYVSP